MALVLWLQDLDGTAVRQAGGKAAGLAELIRAGLPVPGGFVLTTEAYREFVAANALQPEIERLARAAHADDTAGLETASQTIARHFTSGTMPPAVEDAARSAYRQMGEPEVAVRSSATAEDLPEASFAGQMESFLNVRGAEPLLAAVRRCWASLWTPRAISYRTRQGVPHDAVHLAVVVQQFVEAEAAGVLFTANPVTGHRNQMVIDATWGLGEALVGGQVTPDHWIADAASGRVLEAHTGRKEVMTARTDDGTRTVPVPAELQERPVLDGAKVAALVAFGRRAQTHFAAPQDVEWVQAGGMLYLVQSRPITSLFPLPQPADADYRVYLSGNLLQGIVEPLTPVGLSLFRILTRTTAEIKYGKKPGAGPAPEFRAAAGRMFFDFTAALRHPRGRSLLPKLMAVVDHHVSEIIRTLLEREPRLAPVRGGPPARFSLGYALPVLWQTLSVVISPDRTPPRLVRWAERLVRQVEEAAGGVNSPAECRRFLERTLPGVWPQMIPLVMPLVFPGIAARFLTEHLLTRWLDDPAALQPVLRSLPHNPTMEMDLDLWRISRVLQAEGAEPSAEHPAVREFLARYGHRGVREIDLGMPRWRDDPEHVLNVLRTYLNHGEDADPEKQFREGERVAEEACRELVNRVRRRRGWLRARLARFLLRRVRALGGRREFPKFTVVRMIAAARAAVARTGKALVEQGRLETAEDVFFLDVSDLTSAADLRAAVERNRAEYAREMGRKVVPRVMTSEGEAFYTAPSAVPGALAGTAASPGTFEGTVRVILDPRGARLEPGEVLVAPGTDPAWTPLFLSAGALVMELGGIMSHGSVVAREYGIPAVVGVPDATHQLRTGQRVRVDGESGLVVPL